MTNLPDVRKRQIRSTSGVGAEPVARRFIGIDVDEQALRTTAARIAELEAAA
jgi:hypothetical protein